MKTLWTFFEKNCVDLIILLFTLRSINKQSEDHVSGKDAGLAIVVLQLAMEAWSTYFPASAWPHVQ